MSAKRLNIQENPVERRIETCSEIYVGVCQYKAYGNSMAKVTYWPHSSCSASNSNHHLMWVNGLNYATITTGKRAEVPVCAWRPEKKSPLLLGIKPRFPSFLTHSPHITSVKCTKIVFNNHILTGFGTNTLQNCYISISLARYWNNHIHKIVKILVNFFTL